MTEFLTAFGAFLILHSIPAIAPIRQGLIDRFGRRAYFIAYSVVSLVVLGWLIHATLYLDYVPLWDPAPWQAWATMVTAPIGIFFVLAGLFSVNPLSLSIRPGFHCGSIVAITRHPVLWGFLIWSMAHLVPNGDLGGVLLFGGLALFCIAGFFIVERRAQSTGRRLEPHCRSNFDSAPRRDSWWTRKAISRCADGIRILFDGRPDILASCRRSHIALRRGPSRVGPAGRVIIHD
jgi:uncharacterized membrane protein